MLEVMNSVTQKRMLLNERDLVVVEELASGEVAVVLIRDRVQINLTLAESFESFRSFLAEKKDEEKA